MEMPVPHTSPTVLVLAIVGALVLAWAISQGRRPGRVSRRRRHRAF